MPAKRLYRDMAAEQRLYASAVLAGARIWFDGEFWQKSKSKPGSMYYGSYTPSRAAANWLYDEGHITEAERVQLLQSPACWHEEQISTPPSGLGWELNTETAGTEEDSNAT